MVKNMTVRDHGLYTALCKEGSTFGLMLLQVKNGVEYMDYRFLSWDEMLKYHGQPAMDHYDVVYKMYGSADKPDPFENMSTDDILEKLYAACNTGKIKGFKGRAMSIGDVVAIRRNGECGLYYCDRVGFVQFGKLVDGPEIKTEKIPKLYLVVDCRKLNEDCKCEADKIPLLITADRDKAFNCKNENLCEIYITKTDGTLALARDAYGKILES